MPSFTVEGADKWTGREGTWTFKGASAEAVRAAASAGGVMISSIHPSDAVYFDRRDAKPYIALRIAAFVVITFAGLCYLAGVIGIVIAIANRQDSGSLDTLFFALGMILTGGILHLAGETALVIRDIARR